MAKGGEMKILLIGTRHYADEVEEVEVTVEGSRGDNWTFKVKSEDILIEYTISNLTPVMEFLMDMFNKPEAES